MSILPSKPLVGVLYNPAVPALIEAVPHLIEHVEIIPDRLFYDFGDEDRKGRFHHVHAAMQTLEECCKGRLAMGHGIGLSLPSAMPIDLAMVNEVKHTARRYDFAWFSEHMSMFIVPDGEVPNAQAGLGLPVVYCDETFDILREKLAILERELACPLLMENGSIFAQIPDMDYSEPEFFNRLYQELGCGTLLDLHNLYVNWRNGAPHPREYLHELNPDAVHEVHLAGGDELVGFYTDSHSRLTPPDVWQWADEFLPECRNLRAITFEFHESYFDRIGVPQLSAELERMHALAGRLISVPDPVGLHAD